MLQFLKFCFRIIEYLVDHEQLPNEYRASICDLKDPVRYQIGVLGGDRETKAREEIGGTTMDFNNLLLG